MLMSAHVADVVKQIDDVLKRYEEVKRQFTKSYYSEQDRSTSVYIDAPKDVDAEIISLMRNTLNRLSPNGAAAANEVLDGISPSNDDGRISVLAGALRALKSDYESGRLKRFGEMVRSDVFSDFLEMAKYLLKDEGLKDPAAVLASGVLEQHVRKLCEKHSIPTTFVDGKGDTVPKRLNSLNQDLAKAGIYGSNDSKQVVAWADIRNAAAHAHYDKYTASQVELMVQGIRDFLARNPA